MQNTRKEKPEMDLARAVLKQVETKDSMCAFWVLSAITKMRASNPRMPVHEVLTFMEKAMPKAASQWNAYKSPT